MDIEPSIDQPRREGIRDLIYYFLYKSVVGRGEIGRSLTRIKSLLDNTVVDEEVLEKLTVNYLVETNTENVKQVGRITISISWAVHAMEFKAGKETIHVTKDDPLGSMSPAMSALADRLRKRAGSDGVNALDWAVHWIGEVYEDSGRRNILNETNGLVSSNVDRGAYTKAEQTFDKAKKKRIDIELGVAKEANFVVEWLNE